MTQLPQTTSHSVFLVHRRGDTLIVRPRGDAAGFGQAELRSELGRIERLLQTPEFLNLIFDLGAANYFGPAITMQMLKLGRRVIERGGRFGICNASDDMTRGLHIHCDEPFWAEFPSERAAVRKIAKESLVQKAVYHRHQLMAAAVAVMLYGALAYIPFSHRQELNLQEIMTVWRDYNDVYSQPTSSEEFAQFSKRAQKRLEPVLKDLEARASARNRSAQSLLFATRDVLIPLLERRGTVDPESKELYAKLFHVYTMQARLSIDRDKQLLRNPLARLSLGNLKYRI